LAKKPKFSLAFFRKYKKAKVVEKKKKLQIWPQKSQTGSPGQCFCTTYAILFSFELFSIKF